MKKTELFLAVFAIVSICLNLFLVPGGEVLTLLSFGLLSCFYCYFGFALFNNAGFKTMFKKATYKGAGAGRIFGAIAVGLVLGVTIIGILFTFAHYPGGKFIVFIGIGGLIAAIVVGTIKFIKTKAAYYKNIFIRVVIVGGLGLFLLVYSYKRVVEFQYRNYPAFLEAFRKANDDPRNSALWKNVKIEKEKINK